MVARRGPRWSVKITHHPTGIEVVRTSDHFRNHHLAREAAMKYLRARLYQLEPKPQDLKIEYYDPNEEKT